MTTRLLRRFGFLLLCLLGTAGWELSAVDPLPAKEKDYVKFEKGRLNADLNGMKLDRFLAELAAVTHWEILAEPDHNPALSAKVVDRHPSDALSVLLGETSFAVVPGTEGKTRLYVYKTNRSNATLRVSPRYANGERIPNELIIGLRPGAPVDLAQLTASLGGVVADSTPALGLHRLKFETAEATEAARKALEANPEIGGLDDNFSVTRPGIQQSTTAAQALPFSLTPTPGETGSTYVMAMLDTPIQRQLVNQPNFYLEEIHLRGEPTGLSAEVTHGTAMGETALRGLNAALQKGSADFRILPIDIYGNTETTSTYEITRGISVAITKGAKIINISSGGYTSAGYLEAAVSYANSKGISIFAAAGNDATDRPVYPAAYPNSIAITALDPQGKLAPYANYGSFVDFGAPGTAVIGLKNQNFVVTGTSPASAFAAGNRAGTILRGSPGGSGAASPILDFPAVAK